MTYGQILFVRCFMNNKPDSYKNSKIGLNLKHKTTVMSSAAKAYFESLKIIFILLIGFTFLYFI